MILSSLAERIGCCRGCCKGAAYDSAAADARKMVVKSISVGCVKKSNVRMTQKFVGSALLRLSCALLRLSCALLLQISATDNLVLQNDNVTARYRMKGKFWFIARSVKPALMPAEAC